MGLCQRLGLRDEALLEKGYPPWRRLSAIVPIIHGRRITFGSWEEAGSGVEVMFDDAIAGSDSRRDLDKDP